jgi:hypothetical protein
MVLHTIKEGALVKVAPYKGSSGGVGAVKKKKRRLRSVRHDSQRRATLGNSVVPLPAVEQQRVRSFVVEQDDTAMKQVKNGGVEEGPCPRRVRQHETKNRMLAQRRPTMMMHIELILIMYWS